MGRPKGLKNLKSSKIARATAGYHGKFGEAVQELRDGRIEEETKYQYGRTIEAIKRWFHKQEEYRHEILICSMKKESS